MPEPAISIVVPAYNAQATLDACLASLCALSYPPAQTEIYVVDNASQDRTRAIVESFAPRVQYLYQAKRGPAAARNRGIAHAQTDLIAFTDADCIVEPDWLTHLSASLADPQVGIVGGAIRATRPCNAVEEFGEQIHDHARAICGVKPAYVIGMNWAAPRAVLVECGGFDETLLRGEDSDLAWRVLQTGRQLVYQPRAVIYHHNEKTVRGLFREGYQHGYYSVRVNRKHREFLQSYGYRRVSRASYVRLGVSLREYLATRSPAALYTLAFQGGKKLGRLVGSARAGYPEL